MNISISEMNNQICWASKEIYQRDLVNVGEGNISIRVKDKEEMVITPSMNNYLEPLPEDMVHITFEGKVLSPTSNPSSEFFLHKYFYKQRPKANCVIHTHSTYASILAVQRKALPMIFEEMAVFLGGGVPCSEYAQTGTEQLGKNALEAMGKQNAAILTNHGLIIIGRSVKHCVFGAQLVEKMSKIYVNSISMGEVYKIPEENLSNLLDRFQEEFSTI